MIKSENGTKLSQGNLKLINLASKQTMDHIWRSQGQLTIFSENNEKSDDFAKFQN